jgi:phosphoglycerol transferase
MLVAVIGVTLIINLAPTILYRRAMGPNPIAVTRFPSDADIYGLRIAQMILPVTHHRIQWLAELKSRYVVDFPLINENDSATLGVVATIGLVMLLVLLVLPVRSLAQSATLRMLAPLVLVSLLIGTIGGFGSVFNHTVSPIIRSYNRISIFIGLFALLAVGWSIDQLCDRLRHFEWMRVGAPSAIGLMTVLAVLDQTTDHYVPEYAQNEADFASDADFTRRLESSVPPGSMIFELPIAPFPEAPPKYKMADYQLFRPYLHSNALRWSHGAMKGRGVEAWHKSLSATGDLKEMMVSLARQGFRGVVINRDAFSNPTVEQVVAAACRTKPMVSNDERLVYFDFSQVSHP